MPFPMLSRRYACTAGAMAGVLGIHVARAAAPVFSGTPPTAVQAAEEARDAAEREAFWQHVPLRAQDGASLAPSALHRPVVLVNMWAHWCPGCLLEFASMRRMAAAMGDRLDVLLVSHPVNWVADQAFAARHPIGFPLYTFPSGTSQDTIDLAYAAESPGAYSVPQSLALAGRRRQLAWSVEGAEEWDSPAMLAKMDSLGAGNG